MNFEENRSFFLKKFIVGDFNTNCYIVFCRKSHKGLLIDPGAYDKNIVDYIKKEKITVEYTLNTHGHADHILGNAIFAFPVLIHSVDEVCLQDPRRNLSAFSGVKVKVQSAERLLEDGDIVRVGELQFKIIHTPGHSGGSISILFENILFSGDTLFFEGIGRTDLPGGDHRTILESIHNRLMILPDFCRVLPGHGPETTIEHEKQNNPYL